MAKYCPAACPTRVERLQTVTPTARQPRRAQPRSTGFPTKTRRTSPPPRSDLWQQPQQGPPQRDPTPVNPRGRRKRDGNDAIGDAHGPIAQYTVSGHQVRDGRGNDFDTRHHRLEGGGEKIAAASDSGADDNYSISNRVRSSLAGKHRGGANRSDRLAWTVEGYRQRMIDVGRNRSFTQHQTVHLDYGLFSDSQGGNAKRKRQLNLVACSKQHRDRARGTGSIRRHVDDTDLRMVGEFLQWQQECSALGNRANGPSSFSAETD